MRLTSFFGLLCLWLASCKTEQRAIQNYVEDLRDSSMQVSASLAEPLIQKADLLSIRIYSASLDPQIDALYNLDVNNASAPTQGYLVDQQGNIELPRVGVLRAEGFTKAQLAAQIKQKLSAGELTNPSVIIRFLNFRIYILGEVANPGVQTVAVENLTLLEALAMAGDVTQFGKKKEIKVLRESGGRRQVGIVDVTSAKMFESPFFQLRQNDVVLVEAQRFKTTDAEQQRIIQRVSIGLTIATSLALLYNIFAR